jgi:hypothetical protein
MIARVRILLPFKFSVVNNDAFRVHEFNKGEYRIKIYPPFQCDISGDDTEYTSPIPQRDLLEKLKPLEPQTATDLIKLNGSSTIQANLLQIDFIKSTFDRNRILERDDRFNSGDPCPGLIFDVLNDFLNCLRTFTRISSIRTLNYLRSYWRLDYLTDDEKEMMLESNLNRRRLQGPVTWQVVSLTGDMWDEFWKIQKDYQPCTWEQLILDAKYQLPNIGTSIILAWSALETFIAWYLTQVAAKNLSEELWNWINNRDDDWYKQPSVTEQFDSLLKLFTRKSLKDEPTLWEAFQNLRSARNSFSHEGKAMIGRRDNRKEVSLELASNLVVKAQSIIDWTIGLLPQELRRPWYSKKIDFTFTKPSHRNDPGILFTIVNQTPELPLEVRIVTSSINPDDKIVKNM